MFDNLDPSVRDRLKSYDEQSGEVLNKFEQLLLMLTINRLQKYADFDGDGRNFTLRQSPQEDIVTGHYHFKSLPSENSKQYRYHSKLAQYVIDGALDCDTPTQELVFSIGQSHRVSSRMKQLVGQSGTLTVKGLTFTMKANDSDVSESYLLAAGVSDNGETLNQEDVAEMMDLSVSAQNEAVAKIDPAGFARAIDQQKPHLKKRYNTETQVTTTSRKNFSKVRFSISIQNAEKKFENWNINVKICASKQAKQMIQWTS